MFGPGGRLEIVGIIADFTTDCLGSIGRALILGIKTNFVIGAFGDEIEFPVLKKVWEIVF